MANRDWGLVQRVYRVRLERPAPAWLRSATVGADRRLAHPWAADAMGAFVAEGTAAGGGPAPTRAYDAAEPEAVEAALTALTALDSADDAALLGFLNRFGLLGVEEPEHATHLWDSVRGTRREVERIAGLARWLKAMKDGVRADPALPSPEKLRALVPGLPKALSPAQRRHAQWLAFGNELNRALGRHQLRPVLVPDGHAAIRHVLRPRSLAGALYSALWWLATEGDTVMRRCAGCGGLFSVSVSNKKKMYHSTSCKNRTVVRRYRALRARTGAVSTSPRVPLGSASARLPRSQ